MRGKRFVEKVLDTGQKSESPSFRLSANPKNTGSATAPLLETLFFPESARSVLLSRFVLTGTEWNITQLVDSHSEPFHRLPFFEKAKVRNLEISRPFT